LAAAIAAAMKATKTASAADGGGLKRKNNVDGDY
jgi:hypothetical protein